MGHREDRTKDRGRWLVLAAALLWSTSGAFVKSPPLAAIPADQRGPLLACFRVLAAAIVVGAFVRPRQMRWRPMLVPLAVSFALMNVLFVTALTRTTAAAAVFLQYTSTVWAFLFGLLFLGERPNRADLLALACAVGGMTWIIAGDWTTTNAGGNALALGAGICYAGVILSLKHLRDEDSGWLVALCHFTAGLVLLPAVLGSPVSLRPAQWAVIAAFGAIQMGVPYVLFARGLRSTSTQEAALLTLIEPVLNPIWVFVLWGESPTPGTWIGGGLILGGLAARYVLLERMNRRAAETPG